MRLSWGEPLNRKTAKVGILPWILVKLRAKNLVQSVHKYMLLHVWTCNEQTPHSLNHSIKDWKGRRLHWVVSRFSCKGKGRRVHWLDLIKMQPYSWQECSSNVYILQTYALHCTGHHHTNSIKMQPWQLTGKAHRLSVHLYTTSWRVAADTN